MKSITHKGVIAAALSLTILTACGKQEDPVPQIEVIIIEPSVIVIETLETKPWTDQDVQAIALTLAGECYNDKVYDKRRVCEVILNRVSDGSWGDTVLEVLASSSQFNGYWKQNRPVSENDIEVAEQALSDWYANGCEALSDYLYFCAGENRENTFRSEY